MVTQAPKRTDHCGCIPLYHAASCETDHLAAQVYHPEQLAELMADSDFVVAALPATPATDKFITEEAIAAMKPNAVFVNLGRGTTVDEAALTEG